MKHLLYYFFSCFLLLNCKRNTSKFTVLDIKEIIGFNLFDTSLIYRKNIHFDKTRYFIINNFKQYNDTLIENFVKNKMNETDDSNKLYLSNIYMFFKESENTNFNEINKNPRNIDHVSHLNDIVYVFTRGTYRSEKIQRKKYKNGEIVL